MKYKVGDKVVLRSDLIRGKMYGGCYLLPEMYELRGKTVTIKQVMETSPRYTTQECHLPYFTDKMFLDKNEHKYLNLQ